MAYSLQLVSGSGRRVGVASSTPCVLWTSALDARTGYFAYALEDAGTYEFYLGTSLIKTLTLTPSTLAAAPNGARVLVQDVASSWWRLYRVVGDGVEVTTPGGGVIPTTTRAAALSTANYAILPSVGSELDLVDTTPTSSFFRDKRSREFFAGAIQTVADIAPGAIAAVEVSAGRWTASQI